MTNQKYEVGEKVQYRYGGYILFGTVVERVEFGAYTNYMVSGLKRKPVRVPARDILGVFT